MLPLPRLLEAAGVPALPRGWPPPRALRGGADIAAILRRNHGRAM